MTHAERGGFIRPLLGGPDLKGRLFSEVHRQAGDYPLLTASTVAKAATGFARREEIARFKCSIVIDGLKDREQGAMSLAVRRHGVAVGKVRGARDESEPLVRLADRLCGLARDADEGNAAYRRLARKLSQAGILTLL